MQDLPISYFPIAERQSCSETLQKLFTELEMTLGFVPPYSCICLLHRVPSESSCAYHLRPCSTLHSAKQDS